MTTRERERETDEYRRQYYLQHRAEFGLRSAAKAASRRADPALREAFNARQRAWYAARRSEGPSGPMPETSVLSPEETAELKRKWYERY